MDIDMVILENIYIDIDRAILKNIDIDIDIDIDKAILQKIDIDKISNRFKFGISNRASVLSTLYFQSSNVVAVLFYCYHVSHLHWVPGPKSCSCSCSIV